MYSCRLLAFVAALIALTGCGGGESSSDNTASRSGLIVPAVAGATVAEFDDAGRVVQMSHPSGLDGKFEFDRPVTGNRLVVRLEKGYGRAPVWLSARLAGGRNKLVITPVTTLYDVALVAGAAPNAAHELLKELLWGECVASAQDESVLLSAAHGAPLPGEDELAVQLALAGYLRAWAATGLNLMVSDEVPARLRKERALLARACRANRTILDSREIGAREEWVRKEWALPPAFPVPYVRSGASAVAQQVTDFIMNELALAVEPKLSSLMSSGLDTWRGRELDLALVLSVANAVGASEEGSPLVGAIFSHVAERHPWLASVRARQAYSVDWRGHIRSTVTIVDSNQSISAYKSGGQGNFHVVNGGSSDRVVGVDLNGFFLEDDAAVLLDALALEEAWPGEPLYRKSWRYVHTMSRHWTPLTEATFIHRPAYFLRSLGAGFCDDRAAALHWMWLALGYEARVWGISGHVIPEVKINGRWEMYDPDYGVFYYTRARAVAGVEELQDDTSLIWAPTEPFLTSTNPAYADWWKTIYGTKEDNQVGSGYSVNTAGPERTAFMLPPGARLEFNMQSPRQIPILDALNVALVTEWVPEGYSGVVDLPLLLIGIRGEGRVVISGEEYTVNDGATDDAIYSMYQRSGLGLDQIRIVESGAGGIFLDFAANPIRILSAEIPATMLLSGDNLEGVSAYVR